MMMALALSAVALGLLLLPEDFSNPIRLAARDLSRPGQTVTRICVNWGQAGWRGLRAWQARRAEIVELRERLDLELVRQRELQVLLAETRQRLQVAEARARESVPGIATEPLFGPELIEARVLGQETVASAAGRKLLGVGKSQGISENMLVIEPDRATLDIGTDHGLTIHQPVFAGEIVLGRTATCGRYSCSLQPVTDAKFLGSAQLLKKTESGLQLGPEGVLEGTGKDLCRLTGIRSEEAVEVGDEVYTPAEDPLLPHPMFYGRIVRAELKEGLSHWEIDVESASKNLRSSFVRVLRPKENGSRITAN
jgi:cell shape-determining protein MreC